MSMITCKATPETIHAWTIIRLPQEASAQLPSRGQVMVKGTLNNVDFTLPLEPDGKWGHWLKVEDALRTAAHVAPGDTVTITISPLKDWPEPDVPADLQKAIASDPEVLDLWERITPRARWDWIRWTKSTGRDETRARRIKVACSKLKHGERRPCCWNRNLCAEPSVSKNGVLLDPSDPNA